jgi:hypothetical protein
MELHADHPQIPLLFFIEGSKEADVGAALMQETIDALARSRTWALGPPRFINETELSDRPGELPRRIVGGVLDLYSAFPPWGGQLPSQVDRQQLQDAEAVVDAMTEFSAGTGHSIIFMYEGEDIGAIDAGDPDDGLTEGLLGEWRRALDGSQRGRH